MNAVYNFLSSKLPAEWCTMEKSSLKTDMPEPPPSLTITPFIVSKILMTWPNFNSLFTIATLVNNVAFQIFPDRTVLGTNIIIRCASIAFALYSRNKTRKASDTVSVASVSRNEAKIVSDAISIAAILILTNGCTTATVADLTFEGINFYCYEVSREICKSHTTSFFNKKTKKEAQRPLPHPYTLKFEDPKVPANACRLLNIDEKQKEDQDLIEKQYKKIHEMHFSRQKDINSEILAYQFQLMIDHLNEAYKTLKKT